jgi:hypothetical protein
LELIKPQINKFLLKILSCPAAVSAAVFRLNVDVLSATCLILLLTSLPWLLSLLLQVLVVSSVFVIAVNGFPSS